VRRWGFFLGKLQGKEEEEKKKRKNEEIKEIFKKFSRKSEEIPIQVLSIKVH